MLFFLVPFAALWGGGSVGMIYLRPLLQGKGIPVQEALFGLPFLIGTLVLLGVIAFLIAGRWVIRCEDREGSVFLGVGTWGWTRRFPLEKGGTVTLEYRGASVNNRPVPAVVVRCGGKEVAFGAFLKDDAKRWLAARLAAYLRAI